MKKRAFTLAIVVTAFSALAASHLAAQSSAKAQRKTISSLEKELVKAAQANVRSTLRDPLSARFYGGYVRGDAVCGLVNAKNAFGGYTGETVYLYLIKTGESFILEHGDRTYTEEVKLNSLFRKYCGP